MKFNTFLVSISCIILCTCKTEPPSSKWSITNTENEIRIKAGILERKLQISKDHIQTSFLSVNERNIISDTFPEFSITLWKASPNEKPQGIDYSDIAGVEQEDAVKNQTDAVKVEKKNNQTQQVVEWINPLEITGKQTKTLFDSTNYSITSPEKDKTMLAISFHVSEAEEWKGISSEINYEIYNGYPAIRKWITVTNKSNSWIKIDHLIIDYPQIKHTLSHQTILSPPSKGIDPCIVAFSDPDASSGLILSSEIPSKLRLLSEEGKTAYNPDFFEWVLGPGETFKSEPVFIYAFSGKSYPTVSAISTALDRCIETDFHSFLNKHIIRSTKRESPAPVFCTWTNYGANINDNNMRTAADIASQIGFKCFQLDAGWSETGPNSGWAVSTTNANAIKFPNLKDLSNFIQSKNMEPGLWYSVFINEDHAHKRGKEPMLFSLPLIRRAGGLGLSFCYEPSRKKYEDEIVYLHQNFDINYFKQDLSNICYGDIARGHESRTLKESYLRGLRGLFASQDKIHRQAPDTWLQLSHEIYWETPGPEADIAVLKHVDSYHAAPNEYWGAGNRKKLVSPTWDYNVDSLRQKLIQGAFRARNIMYAHRGLPLERIEIFGAVTTNFKESLTPEIQDRQICSWLMGAPLSFSGDLTSLTKENIERYHNRFAMLDRLQKEYDIYPCFQYSGVPAPTDEGWHWWGKLNKEGTGVVIVLRGSKGEETRKINIPWVIPDKEYKVKGLFSKTELGIFKGEKLQEGILRLSLKPYGQEIIELSGN